MSRPQANAKVMVDDADFEKAQKLMVEWEATDPDISAALIRCPQCSSSNIEYPQMTRKFMTPALVGMLCALKIIPKEFYCQDCHFTWSNGKSRQSDASGTASFRERIRQGGLVARPFQMAGAIDASQTILRVMDPGCRKNTCLLFASDG